MNITRWEMMVLSSLHFRNEMHSYVSPIGILCCKSSQGCQQKFKMSFAQVIPQINEWCKFQQRTHCNLLRTSLKCVTTVGVQAAICSDNKINLTSQSLLA